MSRKTAETGNYSITPSRILFMGEGRDRALVDLVGSNLGSSSLGSQCREGFTGFGRYAKEHLYVSHRKAEINRSGSKK